jgi:hypothetical protein
LHYYFHQIYTEGNTHQVEEGLASK